MSVMRAMKIMNNEYIFIHPNHTQSSTPTHLRCVCQPCGLLASIEIHRFLSVYHELSNASKNM